jgi:hypothetical protein
VVAFVFAVILKCPQRRHARHLDQTCNARRELYAEGEAQSSVTVVAMRWGFWAPARMRPARALSAGHPSSRLYRSRIEPSPCDP